MPTEPPVFSSFVELLRWRAQHEPDRPAITFLLDGCSTEAKLTYGKLDRQARAIAVQLQARWPVGERAMLLYAPGLDYVAAFFGCLYAGIIAVPAYPPDPSQLAQSLPRLQKIIENARPAVALTTSAVLSLVEFLRQQAPDLPALEWLATDTMTDEGAQWRASDIDGDTLAFLQYTSGSTSAPKGVMLTHGNLLCNSTFSRDSLGATSKSRVVSWLPPYHDMGLIGGILQPIFTGFPVILMSPIDFLKRPFRWLQAISRYQATHSGGPNFAYELCVRKITDQQRAGLDLSHWEVAFNGAEPIRPETLARFAEAFAPCGFHPNSFYPCYGLAEATLIVSGGNKLAPPVVSAFKAADLAQNQVVEASSQDNDSRLLVGCGHTMAGQKIVIVDPDTRTPCLSGQVGEIWVSGASIAQGYWERHEETSYTFRAHVANTGEGPFLRTGDLGFLLNGELFITGRLKDLIIIDGRNHYPQDIEETVESTHPAIKPGGCAAFAVDVDDVERLVVVVKVYRRYLEDKSIESALAAMAKTIQRAILTHHSIRPYRVVMMTKGNIPKTSSGKNQRYLCRTRFLEGDFVDDLELSGTRSGAGMLLHEQ
jgi:acyl-CoA synthetase (AMP-forming)/AMP-acid ligase II